MRIHTQGPPGRGGRHLSASKPKVLCHCISRRHTWNFYDLEAATCLKSVSDEAVKEAYTTVSFHPDGMISGTGELYCMVIG